MRRPTPWKPGRGSTKFRSRNRIQQQTIRVEITQCHFPSCHRNCLPQWDLRLDEALAKFWRFGPMQLQAINAVDCRNLFSVCRGRIYQYPNTDDRIGQLSDPLCRLRRLEVAFAPLPEIEAKSVSASCNDAFGVSRIGDAADFDEHRSFLRRGGKAERRFGEIRRRHVFDQLYDSILP